MPLKISDIGEKGLIKRILKKTAKNTLNSSFFDEISIKSMSDDAALINFGDHYLVITSDMLFKSTHFPNEMTPQQMGKKSVTVNVSDLAAMGAKPLGIIVSLGLPRDMLLDDFDRLVDGILDGCSEYEIMLIGGDTNESKELTICGTCLGIVKKNEVLMKSGARAGNIVAVTGPLGLAAAGFEVIFNNLELNNDFKETLINHALEPEAKSKEGILLAQNGSITSNTDITDGLAKEIGELIEANEGNIGITIDEKLLPIPDEVLEVAGKIDKDPLDMVLYYGEDFELLLTINKDDFSQIKNKIPLYKIGSVNSSGKMTIISKDGTERKLEPKGYEHLS